MAKYIYLKIVSVLPLDLYQTIEPMNRDHTPELEND